jgi:hypothetical protein
MVVVLTWLTAEAAAPLRVAMRSEYCPAEDLVEMRVENVSDALLRASFSVRRVEASREWSEFSSDVLGTERYPMQVIVVPLYPKVPRTIRWRPRTNGNARTWSVGTYRVVAHWLEENAPRASEGVVAEFAVRDGPRCQAGGAVRGQESPDGRGRSDRSAPRGSAAGGRDAGR